MFSLISGIIKWLLTKVEVQLLILGLDGAGKTTFLENTKNIYRANNKSGGVPLDRIPPTVGLNIGTIKKSYCYLNKLKKTKKKQNRTSRN